MARVIKIGKKVLGKQSVDDDWTKKADDIITKQAIKEAKEKENLLDHYIQEPFRRAVPVQPQRLDDGSNTPSTPPNDIIGITSNTPSYITTSNSSSPYVSRDWVDNRWYFRGQPVDFNNLTPEIIEAIRNYLNGMY